MPFITNRKSKIYYEVYGTCEEVTLFFAHAFPLNREMWTPQIEYFSRYFRVVVYDILGFGCSDAPNAKEAYGQDRSVEDLSKLVANIGAKFKVVCGLSMGGNIALNLALDCPDAVQAIVLADTGAGSEDPEAFNREVSSWAEAGEREGSAKFITALLNYPVFSHYARQSADAREFLADTVTRNVLHGMTNTAKYAIASRPSIYSLGDRFKELRLPTLIIVGQEDTACLGPANFMLANIPDARLTSFPDTGHFVNLERTDDFNATLLNFIENARGSADQTI